MARAIASKARKQAEKAPPARPAPSPAPGPGVGSALPASVSSQITGSLGVDVSAVRVHSDAGATGAAGMLSSRAFAYGSNVYLGPGERPTDVGLMAHEVAHSVQQGGAPRLQLWTPDGGDRHEHEAQAASRAVMSRSRFSIRERTRPRPQRWGLGSILDWIADKANIIPGFRMFTIVLGVNPINMSAVDRSAANILRAIVEFIPGGGLIVMALDNYGVFEKAGKFVETQLRTLGISGAMIKNALMTFLDSLGLSDILHPGRVWDSAKRIFTDPITRIITFVKNLAVAILTFIRDAILKPLAALAANTRGYDLLKAVLGKDPITGEPVPRTADTLIGGFMKLIGQEEVWQNLKKARAVERAWGWFQGVISGLMGFVRQIPSLFINTLKSLEISDLVLPPKAFVKVVKAFGGFVGQFISWGFNQVLGLLQIIFEVLAPRAMPYIRKAAGAFKTIVKNPIGFIGNLVRAGIQGFRQFGSRFLTHLKKSLIGWLTGTLAGSGIYIPAGFDLKEIIKFVLSVLGLTWANIRSKLLKVIPEPAVVALERGFDIVQTLVRDGPAAAWDKIKEAISDLKGKVMDGIMGFVKSRIVEAAITKLVTSLNPAGAFIQAVIAIYNTVMFFVERLKQIAQVAMSFIDSIAAIASGAIGAAANKVEQTMGGLLTLVISFLARIVGLGKVSDAVKDIVNKIRAPIDKALDKVVAWIVATARRLGKLASRPGEPDTQASKDVKRAVAADLAGKNVSTEQDATALLGGIYARYRPKGLKGIGLAFDPKNPASAAVRVNASLTQTVANLPVLKKGLKAAVDWAYRFHYQKGKTRLYVTYDVDNKPFGGVVENEPDTDAKMHAEQVFKRDMMNALRAHIVAERAAGRIKAPANQRVPVRLTLNRLPCANCAPIVAAMGGDPVMNIAVSASSASNTHTEAIHEESIEAMFAGGVEVSALRIHEAILAKITQIVRASQMKTIKPITANEYAAVAPAIVLIKDNIAKEKALQEMIERVKARIAAKKALAKVPPQGSGVSQ
jgi:hypothetical protein